MTEQSVAPWLLLVLTSGLSSALVSALSGMWTNRHKAAVDEADIAGKLKEIADAALSDVKNCQTEVRGLRERVDALERRARADARRIRGLLAYITYLVQRIREIDPNAVIDPLPDHLA